MKRLILIDGNALVHRAYHALPKTFTDKNGRPTNAIYGFTSMLLKVIDELKPNYLAVAFDRKAPTFRHQEFVGYKEGRPEMDEALVEQLPAIKEITEAFNIPIHEVDGYEGEDLIASLNRQAGKTHQELETIIVTGDRDTLQLVDKDTKVYMPKKGVSETEFYDEQKVEERLGIKPEQVVDFKALSGDASDRIPGVRGIGPKTAIELLKKYGTLENVYKNLGEIEPKVVKKLAEGSESAAMSQKLAKIVDNAPITLDLEKCRFREVDKLSAIKILEKFNFKSLIKRINGEADKKSRPKNPPPENQLSLL